MREYFKCRKTPLSVLKKERDSTKKVTLVHADNF